MKARFAALSLLIALAGCETREPLPVLGEVPPFELVSQDGKPFHGDSLRGHVWVADFIFTNCPGPCLRMSTFLGRVQKATAAFPDVRLVSFSVDPARDTPSALAQFASKYQADPARWSFLTGPQPTLQMLSRDAFKLGDVDGSLNHQTRFVLVDRKGRIRGYYRTDEGDPVSKVAGGRATPTEGKRLIGLHDLPTVNAVLNGTAAILLVWGFTLIRRKKIVEHRRVMLSAFSVSVVFLTCYLIYHFQVGSVRFPRPGWVRNVYWTILFTHTVLAVTVPFLAVITLSRALRGRFPQHRKIARWTFPIWLYVSVTGVIVYLMLYHIYPLI